MEEKFDMMLNNQAKMLEHLTILTKDVNQLKIGQKHLEEGQARLEVRVTSLEEGQEELKKGQKELIERVTLLEKGQESLNKKVEFILDDNKAAKDNLVWITKDHIYTKDRVEARLERIESQIA